MFMEMQPFSKGKWNIGCPIVAGDIPWFRAKDVATSLEYSNPLQAVRKNVEDDDKKTFCELCEGVDETCTSLGSMNEQPHAVYINESGLYCLVLRSSKPRAKSFKRWVTNEVLPSIRRCGHMGNLFTAMNERLEKQEQTLSGQRQLLVDLEQRLLGSCAFAVAASSRWVATALPWLRRLRNKSCESLWFKPLRLSTSKECVYAHGCENGLDTLHAPEAGSARGVL